MTLRPTGRGHRRDLGNSLLRIFSIIRGGLEPPDRARLWLGRETGHSYLC